MTATVVPIVKDQDLSESCSVESTSNNSIAEFVPSKTNKKDLIDEKEKIEFVNTFICHLIFYAFLCISLVLHILIDLGLGYIVRKAFIQLIELIKNNFLEEDPAFA
tara:strand:- start:291 stop:608 length:318 start_codon:yes stop_codon:yes gene_type:complete